LKLHKRSDDGPPPTWWPEARYSSALLHRLEQAELVSVLIVVLVRNGESDVMLQLLLAEWLK